MLAHAKCPYCGHPNQVEIRVFIGNAIIYCDNEGGGCDMQFAYRWDMKVNIEVAKLDFQKGQLSEAGE